MKKLILSLALCCAATNFFAQNTDPAQLVNEGKAALESKNYQLAFTKFSTYLTQTNNQDSVIAFNCGWCFCHNINSVFCRSYVLSALR